MKTKAKWTATGILLLAMAGWNSITHATCVADSGAVDVISADGVTVICDVTDPNPFTTGIGSSGTNTNLTVDIEEDAEVESTTVGVNLGDGGLLTVEGSVTAVDQAVLGTDLSVGDGITIVNDGTLISTAGAGIDLALVDSDVINNGSIAAATHGINVSRSVVENSGSISILDTLGVGINAGVFTAVTNSGEVTSNGVGVDLDTGSTLTNSGTIDAAGTAVLMADGTSLVNTGTIASTSGPAIESGDGVSIANAGALSGVGGDAIRLLGGANELTLQTGSTVSGRILSVGGATTDVLILEGSSSEDDDIETFAALFMRGEGWTLSGSVKAMNVDIETGLLNINGVLDTRDAGLVPGVIQLVGGSLGGLGTVIGDVENLTGTMAAGDPAGTFEIVGDYVQGVDGTMQVRSNIQQVGMLHVSGTATLAGSVVIGAGPDGFYEFLVADGGIVGAFDETLVDGRALVTVIPSANSLAFVRASTTVEDNMVQAALDNALLTLDSLSSATDSPEGGGPWVKALGHYGDRDDTDGVPGGEYTIAGVAFGADWAFGSGKSRLGAAVGYTSTDVDIDDDSDSEADNVIYGAYYEYTGDFVFATLALGGGSNEFDHARSIFINGVRGETTASYDGTTLAARAEIGVSQPLLGDLGQDWLFEPTIGVDYIIIDVDPYTEQGGAGLRISADDIEAIKFSGLFGVRRVSTLDRIAPRMHLGVVHQIAIDDRTWTATDVGSGISFSLPGDDDDDTALSVGVGFDFSIGRRTTGFVDYTGEFSGDIQSHSLIAGLRVDL